MSDEKPKACGNQDVVLVGPEVSPGTCVAVRHTKDHTVQTGLLKLVSEGQPLHDDCLCLSQRGDSNVFDVEGEIKLGSSNEGRSGPAQVATESYRDGWDRIFGGQASVGQA